MIRTASLRRSNSGASAAFTLIEIMLVLAIISVLLGTAIYKLAGNLDIAKERRVESDIDSITTQLKTYEMEALSLPTTEQGLDALVNKPSRDPIPDRWHQLSQVLPMDPWNHPYVYRNPGKHNPTSFDLYSLGPDGQDGTEDDIGNWEKGK
jgi:general secretion pathway protein G